MNAGNSTLKLDTKVNEDSLASHKTDVYFSRSVLFTVLGKVKDLAVSLF